MDGCGDLNGSMRTRTYYYGGKDGERIAALGNPEDRERRVEGCRRGGAACQDRTRWLRPLSLSPTMWTLIIGIRCSDVELSIEHPRVRVCATTERSSARACLGRGVPCMGAPLCPYNLAATSTPPRAMADSPFPSSLFSSWCPRS